MPRVIIRNVLNEVIADFPLPEDWKPAPDIIAFREPYTEGGKFYRLCGNQDGKISYWPATSRTLPDGVEKGLGSQSLGSIISASIGPFHCNHEAKQITLAPGVYKLSKPIVFGITEATEITGVEYDCASTNVDTNPADVKRGLAPDG